MFRVFRLAACAVLLLNLTWTSAQAGLIHSYDLNNTYADSQGGPDLTPNGGTLSASGYTFGPNQGLTLENWLTGSAAAGNYTIDMVFSFSEIKGYNRVLEFKNRTADTGLYIHDGNLNFFNEQTGSDTVAADTLMRVDLTRDGGTGIVAGYLNGVQQFTFNDSISLLAVFDATNNLINFFIDDTAVPGEASGGFADSIHIYDTALTKSEVAALGAVPEPASLVMLGLGLSALGIESSLRRRRKNAR